MSECCYLRTAEKGKKYRKSNGRNKLCITIAGRARCDRENEDKNNAIEEADTGMKGREEKEGMTRTLDNSMTCLASLDDS